MNLQTVSKAIAGAVVTALVGYLAKHNILIGADSVDAINVLLAGGLGFLFVYLAPKNKAD